MKQDQLSYEKIVKEVGCEASDILFLTDIVNGELRFVCILLLLCLCNRFHNNRFVFVMTMFVLAQNFVHTVR